MRSQKLRNRVPVRLVSRQKGARNARPRVEVPLNRLIVIRDRTPDLELADTFEVALSTNSKTGVSINVAIAQTCRPTKACAQYCYGLVGRLAYDKALAAQARNAAFFAGADKAILRHEARRIGRSVLRKQNFLRMFGVGDLQPGSVFFTMVLASEFPELSIWVSTRKLELACQLPLLMNLHVMLSLDATTTRENVESTRKLVLQNKPQFFAAWVRSSWLDKIPRWVSVVFEEHKRGRRAAWDPERRACPATVRDGAEHENACERCRFCFDVERRASGPPLVQISKRP